MHVCRSQEKVKQYLNRDQINNDDRNRLMVIRNPWNQIKHTLIMWIDIYGWDLPHLVRSMVYIYLQGVKEDTIKFTK
jgi:hypothetical protein